MDPLDMDADESLGAYVDLVVRKAMAAHHRRARTHAGRMRWNRRDPRPVWRRADAEVRP